MSSPIEVPAEHIQHIGLVISELQEVGGLPLSGLVVAVSENELELKDETGSYGVRRW